MGILLYSNGITEDYVSQDVTFTEAELTSIFYDFALIKTKRLITILNTWCIWGQNDNYDITEINRIASDITQEPIYSTCLFVHDSEINPDWNATDNILYRNYAEFIGDIKRLIETSAINVVEEFKKYEDEDYVRYFPVLDAIGSTKDKRVIYAFNPFKQHEEFYEDSEFIKFSHRAYEYMKMHIQDELPFTIFADKKAIVVVDAVHVSDFMKKLVDTFKAEEQYEICNDLTNMLTIWNKSMSNSEKINRRPSSDI